MNIVRFSPKIALAASVSFAMAFTISCSSSDDDGGGDSSKPIVYNESYALKDVTESSFTYVETYQYTRCLEEGILETVDKEYDETINYSLSGNTLSWDTYWNDRDATLDFTGTSSNLYGTWTRTKNKDADCEPSRWDDDEMSCKRGWNYTKVVFKENPSTIDITVDYCETDWLVEGSERRGYTYRNFNCNQYELYKGNSVITVKYTESIYTISYNGRSCTFKDPTHAQEVQACKDAWDKHVASGGSYFSDYSHENILYEDINKCEQDLLPEDFLNGYNEKVSAKILPKKELFFNAKRSKQK